MYNMTTNMWPAKYGNECGELVWLIFCTAKLNLLVFEDLILMGGLYMGDLYIDGRAVHG